MLCLIRANPTRCADWFSLLPTAYCRHPHQLIHHHPARHRHVQRIRPPAHRQAHHPLAQRRAPRRDAGALLADQQGDRPCPRQQVDPRQGLCWLVVEWIRSPGNLGSILRTAEAVGAAGAIFLGEAADPFDPAVVRASMGGLFGLQLVRTTHEHLGRWARSHGVMVVGLSPDAPELWTDPLPAARPIALLIGEERAGVSAGGAALCERMVRLPMSGRADSLNVSVASGVMMYELVRRRGLAIGSGR